MEEKSFSKITKENICKAVPKAVCCRKALLYGCLAFALRSEGGAVVLKAEKDVSKLYSRLLSEFMAFPRLKEDFPKTYEISRAQMGTFTDNTASKIDESFFVCENCKRYFASGVFISRGSVSQPEKGYRLELTFTEKWNMQLFFDFLFENFSEPMKTERDGIYVLYYKASESIEDFLSYIGAQKSAFDVMNARIEKDIRNNANRIVNCDSHNISKATAAGREQAKAAEYLYKSGKFSALPDELKETAKFRMENPELPLTELALLHEPAISKSGLNHRLRKITEKAKEEAEKKHEEI